MELDTAIAGAVSLAHAGWLHGRDYQVVDLGGGRHALFVTGNHRILLIEEGTASRLRRGLEHLTEEEVRDWNALASCGAVGADNTRVTTSSHWSDGANLAINVNLTAICNLSCTYCFAEGGDYGRIRGKLEAATVPRIFDFVREHVTASRTVRFEFFGGEPLLNLERIEEICNEAERVRGESGIRFLYRISTNLTYLPPKALDLLVARGFTVSVSIDGGRETHDRNRPGRNGNGSFETILEHCRRIRAASGDLTLVARMTVAGGEGPTLLENVRELWGYNLFDYFQIYPAVVSAHLAPGVLPQFIEFAAAWPDLFSAGNRFRGVLEYERIADMLVRGKVALAFCSGGRNYFTFSPDESIMSCHRLVGDVRFQAGTAVKGLETEPAAWRLPVDTNPVCSQCWARYVCGGGCKQENFLATGDISTPSPDLCRHQTQLLESVIRVVARGEGAYAGRDRRQLDDLFVSCGRPVTDNGRVSAAVPNATFRSLEG